MAASAPPAPSVGVVIRTLDESALLGRCLDVLAAQDCGADLDVLVVDSGSTDGTTDIARAHGARLVGIAPEDFDYSRALNLGIEAVRGDVVVILSAHAIPVDGTWLRRMLDPFADPLVAGVASRQLPWAGASYREVHRLSSAFDGRRRTFEAGCAEPILFSNAASCVRRSVWKAEPFTLPAAEDFEWAQRVTAAGWKVIYEPAAQVHHSHDEGPRAQARRLIDLNRKGLQGAQHQPPWATLREALTYLRRDARVILRLSDPVPRKLAHLRELLAMVCYYVADSSKQGSTAEFRRDVTPRGRGEQLERITSSNPDSATVPARRRRRLIRPLAWSAALLSRLVHPPGQSRLGWGNEGAGDRSTERHTQAGGGVSRTRSAGGQQPLDELAHGRFGLARR